MNLTDFYRSICNSVKDVNAVITINTHTCISDPIGLHKHCFTISPSHWKPLNDSHARVNQMRFCVLIIVVLRHMANVSCISERLINWTDHVCYYSDNLSRHFIVHGHTIWTRSLNLTLGRAWRRSSDYIYQVWLGKTSSNKITEFKIKKITNRRKI